MSAQLSIPTQKHTAAYWGRQMLGFTPRESGRWLQRQLPGHLGKTRFRTCQICPDITLTHSRCQFSRGFESAIQYERPTSLLVFGLEGVSTFRFSSTQASIQVRPGDIWLFNTGEQTLHRYSHPDSLNEMVVLKYLSERISTAFINQSHSHQRNLTMDALRLAFMEDTHKWLNSLLTNPLNTAGDRLIAQARALEVMACWLGETDACNASTSSMSVSEHTAVTEVTEILCRDLCQTPSLGYLARHVGMSHTRLNRCFKKAYGQTVFVWLKRQRLARAREQLSHPSHSITQIALNCGFSSASHFTQDFKAHYKCTPAAYRNR